MLEHKAFTVDGINNFLEFKDEESVTYIIILMEIWKIMRIIKRFLYIKNINLKTKYNLQLKKGYEKN